MNSFLILLAFSGLLGVRSQRPPPGVNPQHYQQGQYQQPQYQQQHPQYQQQHPPVQQVPVQQQYQQQQVPVQQFQQPPMQQQVPVHHQQPPQPQGHAHGHHGGHQQRPIFSQENMAHEKEHIQEHLEMPIDTSKMTDQELQFHYFKMHDADNNNKLDGCELIKSLIHWHEQGSKEKQEIEEKIFKDDELVNLIDPILNVDDGNKDGYIDYPEFIKAQQKAAGQKTAS
ncbi:multiple coagulation factor deficiency protein 2 homolog isoform X2 [Anthonomus grandis grandis]|uniref:multiple coagulation factor deficiency protein 2 homolog isoform X2 n=1 Tax=Anthonomus grandis grandis TaxID=2921223 RepID=UPI002165F288|nr:multiple coagulation factor deficiency protein 2 homolog isoform X2 [Anthonomus grandis grandis]